MQAVEMPVPPPADEEPSWAELGARPLSARTLAAQEPPRKIGASAAAEPSAGGVLGWTLVVLALIAGAAVAARRLLRRSGLLGGSGPIAVVARRALGPRQDLFLVEVGPRLFLIGATRDRLATLGEFARAEEIAVVRAKCPEGPAEAEFRATLRETLRASAPAPASYSDIAGEIAEIRKTVDGWRA